MLTSLLFLFYVTGEFHRFLHRGRAKFNLKTYGSRAFSVCEPRLWNSLPLEIRKCDSIDTFKVNLRLIFLRVHILVSFYLYISIIIITIIIFLEFVKRSWTL